MSAPICSTCTRETRLTNGAEIYPHRPDLHEKPIWRCDECHTGLFDLETCRRAWIALAGVDYPQVRAWAKARREAA